MNNRDSLFIDSSRYLLLNEAYLDIFRVLLNSSSTIEEIAEVFLDKAKALTGSKFGYVNTIDPKTGVATSRTISKMMGKDCKINGHDRRVTFPPDKNGKYSSLWGFALNEKKSFFTNEPSGHSSSRGLPKGHIAVENFLSVPVISDGILIGQIALANSETGYSRKDLEVIEKLTDLYIIAVRIKQVEQEKESDREKFKVLVENMYEGLWQIDRNAETVFVNSKMAEMLGYTVGEMTGKSLFCFMDDEGRKAAQYNIQRRKSGIKEEHDFEFIKKDGSRILTRLETSPLFDKNGKYDGALANITDITERRHMEEKLRNNEKMLQKIFEILPVGLWIADKNGKLILSNKKAREIWGAEPLVGQQEYGVFKARRLPSGKEIEPDDWALAHTINEGVTITDEMLEIDAFDGKKKTLLNYTAPVTGDNGKVEAGIVVNLDISEQVKAENELKKSYEQIKKTLKGTINTLSLILEIKDPYTQNHQRNVARLCRAMAGELSFDENEIEMLYTAALIHDIGKIAIPASILSKPSELTNIEISMIHTHSQFGHDILSKIDFGYPLPEIVLQHHERIDGSGYPQGLKNMDILFDAKVLAVADTIEAMANHRPYRPAYGIEKALEEIKAGRGILFDESAVDACMAVFAKKKFKF